MQPAVAAFIIHGVHALNAHRQSAVEGGLR